MSTIDVKVPDIGDFKDIPVIEVLVKAGDTVKAEDSLVTLESDKATMDVPSPAAGVVKEVKLKVGDKVSEGTPGAHPRCRRQRPRKACARPSPAPAPAPPAAAERSAAATRQRLHPRQSQGGRGASPAPRLQRPVDAAAFTAAHASPSVRKFARELGVDLAKRQRDGAERAHPPGGRAGYVKRR